MENPRDAAPPFPGLGFASGKSKLSQVFPTFFPPFPDDSGDFGKGKNIGMDPFFLGKNPGIWDHPGSRKVGKNSQNLGGKKKPGEGWEYSRRRGENPVFFWICGFPLGILGSKLELGLEFWDFKLELWDFKSEFRDPNENWARNFGIQVKSGLKIPKEIRGRALPSLPVFPRIFHLHPWDPGGRSGPDFSRDSGGKKPGMTSEKRRGRGRRCRPGPIPDPDPGWNFPSLPP